MENPEHSRVEGELRSPFADALPRANRRRFPYAVAAAVLGALAIGLISYALIRNSTDPLRKLSKFPVEDYHSNYTSLLGTRYQAELKVVNQIAWNDAKGRLITFQIADTEKPIVALVNQSLSAMDMRGGDRILCEIDVDQGGLLRIPYARKE